MQKTDLLGYPQSDGKQSTVGYNDETLKIVLERQLTTILSTSSRRKTGLFSPTVLRPCMIFPGMAPTYVLRWPRTSDWSDTPPREILHAGNAQRSWESEIKHFPLIFQEKSCHLSAWSRGKGTCSVPCSTYVPTQTTHHVESSSLPTPNTHAQISSHIPTTNDYA